MRTSLRLLHCQMHITHRDIHRLLYCPPIYHTLSSSPSPSLPGSHGPFLPPLCVQLLHVRYHGHSGEGTDSYSHCPGPVFLFQIQTAEPKPWNKPTLIFMVPIPRLLSTLLCFPKNHGLYPLSGPPYCSTSSHSPPP